MFYFLETSMRLFPFSMFPFSTFVVFQSQHVVEFSKRYIYIIIAVFCFNILGVFPNGKGYKPNTDIEFLPTLNPYGINENAKCGIMNAKFVVNSRQFVFVPTSNFTNHLRKFYVKGKSSPFSHSQSIRF